jgi:DNA-binding transcriptional MocR family regulator
MRWLTREGRTLATYGLESGPQGYRRLREFLAQKLKRTVGIPLDGDGMRMDALAAALDDLKRRGIRPKYIYTVPIVQNPTGTILSEAPRRDRANRNDAAHGVRRI